MLHGAGGAGTATGQLRRDEVIVLRGSQLRLNTVVLGDEAYHECEGEIATGHRLYSLYTRAPTVYHSTSYNMPNKCTGRLSELFRTCLWRFEPLGAIKGMHSFFSDCPIFRTFSRPLGSSKNLYNTV